MKELSIFSTKWFRSKSLNALLVPPYTFPAPPFPAFHWKRVSFIESIALTSKALEASDKKYEIGSLCIINDFSLDSKVIFLRNVNAFIILSFAMTGCVLPNYNQLKILIDNSFQ